jgi:hypothetical protein
MYFDILIFEIDNFSSNQFCSILKSTCGRDLAEWLERLTATTEVATVIGSTPAAGTIVGFKGLRNRFPAPRLYLINDDFFLFQFTDSWSLVNFYNFMTLIIFLLTKALNIFICKKNTIPDGMGT